MRRNETSLGACKQEVEEGGLTSASAAAPSATAAAEAATAPAASVICHRGVHSPGRLVRGAKQLCT